MNVASILKTKRAPPPPRRKPANLQAQSQPSPSKPQSLKKGIGWPWDNPASHFPLYTTDLPSVHWCMNWELWVPPGLPESIEWIPCVRTPGQINDLIPFLTDTVTNQKRVITALLGFNEPEIPSQANMSVEVAVKLWQDFVLPAKQKFGLRLGSPGVSSDAGLSKPWLDQFFDQLKGADEIEFLVLHWYGPRFSDMKDFLGDMYRTYQKPIWVNEFACSKMGNGEVSEQDVMQFLEEAVPWLEKTVWIERYAYFGNAQGRDVGEWVGRSNNFTEIADGCESTDGRRLSRVGERYLQL